MFAKKYIYDILGWIGMICIVTAYVSSSMEAIAPTSSTYAALNFVGSIFLIANSWHTKTYAVVALNMVWVGISIYTLGSIYIF